ncbi:MAG: BatD family protein [Bdellovibrionota bacterium]
MQPITECPRNSSRNKHSPKENTIWFFLSFALALMPCFSAKASGAQILATPSSTEITEDENLSIEFKVIIEGMGGKVGKPAYKAPDFDEVNIYSSSQSVESRFINGQLTVRKTQNIISVLHPKRAGTLMISDIKVDVDGKLVRAPDIEVRVHPAGTRLAGKGGASAQYPQRGQMPSSGLSSNSAQAGTFFLRAEPSKLKAFKGEQILLTYALYTKVQVLNIQVERYPNISGFLKEDMDIPLLRGHLDYSPSVVNGQEYRRAVLAQYAIYPLKEGKLPVDAFTGKFSFQAGMRAFSDDDDPFGMLNQFFRAMQTTTATRSSDRITIEVLPLPGEGQPQGFSGLVGDFDITAMVDKYSTKVGEPINVKVKIEGKGHAGSLESLNVKWPADFELYEDKSHTQFLKTGHSERLFEYMLIPKVKGSFEVAPIEVSMFNPESKNYQVRKTEPLKNEVLEGTVGNIYVAKEKATGQSKTRDDIRYWMSEAPSQGFAMLWLWVSRGIVMATTLFAALGLWSISGNKEDALRSSRKQRGQAIRARAAALQSAQLSAVEALGKVETVLGELIEFRYGIQIGSLTRAEIREALAGRGPKDEGMAKRVEALLELCENSRYMPGGATPVAAQQAADELGKLVELMSLT